MFSIISLFLVILNHLEPRKVIVNEGNEYFVKYYKRISALEYFFDINVLKLTGSRFIRKNCILTLTLIEPSTGQSNCCVL